MTEVLNVRRYGFVGANEKSAQDRLSFVQGLIAGTQSLNTMARTLGYDIVEASNGRVVVIATPNAEHLIPNATVHGGLSVTVFDTCMGIELLSTLEIGLSSTILEFKISFLRPVTRELDLIKAEGVAPNCGRRVGTAEEKLTGLQGSASCAPYDNLFSN